MGILVGGCVRTWEPAIARTLLWMAGIVDGTPPHVESGALVYMDGTDMELLSRLQEWTAAPSGQHAAIVGLDPPDSRLARLALCRNVLMVEATRKLAPTGVFISADMDCMLPELPTLLLAASFLNGQAVVPTATSGPYFDVVTANNYGYRHKAARTYRDRWALRSEGIDYDCWNSSLDWNKTNAFGGSVYGPLSANLSLREHFDGGLPCHHFYLTLFESEPPFTVTSAFNGLGLYSMAALHRHEGAMACRYDAAVDYASLENRRQTCEHVSFHTCATRLGVRIGILPWLVDCCVGEQLCTQRNHSTAGGDEAASAEASQRFHDREMRVDIFHAVRWLDHTISQEADSRSPEHITATVSPRGQERISQEAEAEDPFVFEPEVDKVMDIIINSYEVADRPTPGTPSARMRREPKQGLEPKGFEALQHHATLRQHSLEVLQDIRPRCPEEGALTQLRFDGFGSQYLSMISVLSYAARWGCRYQSTPWLDDIRKGVPYEVRYESNGSKMFDFVGGDAFGPRAPPQTPRAQSAFVCWPGTPAQQAVVAAAGGAQEDGMPAGLDTLDYEPPHDEGEPSVRALVRRHYHERQSIHPPAQLLADDGRFHVAVHVRRGDVSNHSIEHVTETACKGRCWERHVLDSDVVQCMQFMRANLTVPQRRLAWHLFSDANTTETFDNLMLVLRAHGFTDLQVHLGGGPGAVSLERSFHAMVRADALLIAPSALSWVAAYLAESTHLFRTGKIYGHHLPGLQSCLPPQLMMPQEHSGCSELRIGTRLKVEPAFQCQANSSQAQRGSYICNRPGQLEANILW